jgi:endoglycosylceramidase
MNRLVLSLILAVLLAGCASEPEGDTSPSTPHLTTSRLTVEGTRIHDALGREVILRGINTGGSSKVPPFMPFAFQEAGLEGHGDAPPFAEAVEIYAARLADWGFNVARVPFTWEAVEPVRGEYDEVFLTRYEALIDALGRHGVRTIVDFHQDVFARPFCGDGFPLWAILDPIEDELGYACHQWFLGYLDETGPVRAAYQHFWDNDDGLRDAFRAMWRHVAERLWTEEGALMGEGTVIGFEIINEPFNGTAQTNDVFAQEVLPAFYEEVIAEIRAVAPEALIFFDSTGLDATSQVTALVPPTGPGLVFAPHFYDGLIFLSGTWNPDTDYVERMGNWRSLGDDWSVPVLVGEFGIKRVSADANAYLDRNYAAIDHHLVHATHWEYSTAPVDWNDEGMSVTLPDGTESGLVAAMVRAYPRAVAGKITSFTYDPTTRTGTLVYGARAGETTEIVAPLRLYPDGDLEVTIQGSEGAWNYDAQVIYVTPESAVEVTVVFAPGPA